MKEPINHVETATGMDEPSGWYCSKDGEPWPCTKVQKWRDSPEYRVLALTKTVNRLLGQVSRLEEMQETVRNTQSIVENGIYPAIQDIGRTGKMGILELDYQTEAVEVGPIGRSRAFVPGRRSLEVKYTSLHSGKTTVNGIVTEAWRKL